MAAPGSNTLSPPRGLTPAFIDALRPDQAARYEVADRRAPGLRLRVLQSGRKVFRWYCTARGEVVTIGPWTLGEQPGHVTLAQAREWLDRLKAAHEAGALEGVEGELRTHLRRRAHVADPVLADRRLFGTVAEETGAARGRRRGARPRAPASCSSGAALATGRPFLCRAASRSIAPSPAGGRRSDRGA